MAQPPPLPTSAPAALPHTAPHIHRRIFIGPMPDKVLTHTEAQARAAGPDAPDAPADADEPAVPATPLAPAAVRAFFLRTGGRAEDWGAPAERGARAEMRRRWARSEWRALWARRAAGAPQPRWAGASFEVGDALGGGGGGGGGGAAGDASTSAAATFVTARETATESAPAPASASTPSTAPETFVTAPAGAAASDGGSPASSTALLRPAPAPAPRKARTEVLRRPILKLPSSAGAQSARPASRGERAVHYASAAGPTPAPPGEVLERTGSAIDTTSAGAVAERDTVGGMQWGDVVLRDRMLVRVSYARSAALGGAFDETQHRTTRGLQHEDWAEFVVAWRADQLELYEDYSLPGKEWVTGHKHLAYVVPLKAPRTRLSLYSFVDHTFCVTCAPTTAGASKSRPLLHRAKEGTNVFVFKTRSRTRALDWMWQLWRHLGGELPAYLEVRSSILDTKVKIDVPHADVAAAMPDLRMFSRANMLALCVKSLRAIGSWEGILEREMAKGKTLGLAWHLDTSLDWIWFDDDVSGHPRDWAVLCGVALRQANRPAHLEIRLSEHGPPPLTLPGGVHLPEPPAIEGYLERIKPTSQVRTRIYLATHDGNLFVLAPERAHPPTPPGLPGAGATLRVAETARGGAQISSATGVVDLRTVVAVRRAFQATSAQTHREAEPNVDGDAWIEAWMRAEEADASDDEDAGGEEGLARAVDRPRQKMMRAFELLLQTGHVIRLEAHSRLVALEWIDRLRALVLYWKLRHRRDARDEMDLVENFHPRLTPPTHALRDDAELPPAPPGDPTAALPALSLLYSQCVLDGCRAIAKGGKLFARRGLHGQYKLVQLFLVAGHLVRFRVRPRKALHRAGGKRISLADAYVCAGYLAALTLPAGQLSPGAPPLARRYQDGLEARDPEEDRLFMVWYGAPAPMGGVPALSAKRKVAIFRTRSRLERDVWCWALNCEIEKIVRGQKEREERVRESGRLMDFGS